MKYLFILICISFFLSPKENGLLSNHVKGMAIEYNNELYTLNFEQQTQVIQILNHAEFCSEEEVNTPQKKNCFNYNRLIIYRFEEPNLEVFPVGENNECVIFEIREQNRSTKRMKNSQLHVLLSQTFEVKI